MKCSAYRILVDELENGELNEEEVRLLRQHLEACESCRAYQEGRRASDRNAAADGSFSGDVTYRDEPGAQPAGRSWGWAAVAVIGLAALVAFILMFGHGRRSHGGAGRHQGEAAHQSVWRQP